MTIREAGVIPILSVFTASAIFLKCLNSSASIYSSASVSGDLTSFLEVGPSLQTF
jgi:hypothetical protein